LGLAWGCPGLARFPLKLAKRAQSKQRRQTLVEPGAKPVWLVRKTGKTGSDRMRDRNSRRRLTWPPAMPNSSPARCSSQEVGRRCASATACHRPRLRPPPRPSFRIRARPSPLSGWALDRHK
jgi:hypothetical protein